jgi:hypothetical protein
LFSGGKHFQPAPFLLIRVRGLSQDPAHLRQADLRVAGARIEGRKPPQPTARIRGPLPIGPLVIY